MLVTMQYRLRTLLILMASMACFLAGCRPRSTPVVVPNDPSAPSTAPATYSFEVRTDEGSMQQSASGNADLTIGNTRLQVQDGVFTVNGRSHGRLRDGDKVLIHTDGQVLVNSQVRSPL